MYSKFCFFSWIIFESWRRKDGVIVRQGRDEWVIVGFFLGWWSENNSFGTLRIKKIGKGQEILIVEYVKNWFFFEITEICSFIFFLKSHKLVLFFWKPKIGSFTLILTAAWKLHFCEILELFNILFITVISLLSGPFRSGPTLK